MKYSIVLLVLVSIIFSGCKKKLEKLNGNNVEYEVTEFELTETITFQVPNTIFTVPLNICWDIPLLTVPFKEKVATSNPNPYAHLVHDIIPTTIKMELIGVEGCDFAMLNEVQVYMVDKDVQDKADIIIYDPNNPSMAYNAKHMGTYNDSNGGTTVPNNIGNTMYLTPNPDIRLDEFIHDQDFQVYMDMTIDKTFVEDFATIKTTLGLSVKLINQNN